MSDARGQSEKVDPIAVRPRDAADRLGLSERKVRGLIASGELRSVKIGAARLIPVVDLERLIGQ